MVEAHRHRARPNCFHLPKKNQAVEARLKPTCLNEPAPSEEGSGPGSSRHPMVCPRPALSEEKAGRNRESSIDVDRCLPALPSRRKERPGSRPRRVQKLMQSTCCGQMRTRRSSEPPALRRAPAVFPTCRRNKPACLVRSRLRGEGSGPGRLACCYNHSLLPT